MYLISVIVPVYNVEQYLPECLESLLNQTYKNLDIVLIDDGSTDGSTKLLDAYLSDPRVRVFRQENAGLSAARNTGLAHSHGDYIYFLDSDDRLKPDAIERLYREVEQHGEVAVVSGQFSSIGVAGEKVFEHFFTLPPQYILPKDGVMSGAEAFELYITSKTIYSQPYITNQVYGKLWRRDTFYNFTFPNTHYEDLATTYLLLHRADRVVVTDEKGYEYRHRLGSIMNSGVPDYLVELLPIWQDILSFTRQTYPSLVPAAAYRAYIELMQWSLTRLPWRHPLARQFYKEAIQYRQEAEKYSGQQWQLMLEGRLGYRLARAKRGLLKNLRQLSHRLRELR